MAQPSLFPLYDHYRLCPTAQPVDGKSKYVCNCQQPLQCAGVKAVDMDARQAWLVDKLTSPFGRRKP